MVNFADGLRQSLKDAFCDLLSDGKKFEELVNKGLGTQTDFGSSPAGALYNLTCNRPPPSVPGYFKGGQCNILYDIYFGYTVSGKVRATDEPFSYTTATGLRARLTGKINSIGPVNRGGEYIDIVIGTDHGDYNINVSGSGMLNVGVSVAVSGVNIVPSSNQLDNCGNKPNPFGPFQPGDNMKNITVNYTDNEGNNITVPIIGVFGYMNVNLNGQVYIPVKLNFTANPQLNIDVNLNLPDGSIGVGGSNGDQPALPSPDGGGKPNFDPINAPLPVPGTPDPLDPPNGTDPPTVLKLLKGVIATSAGTTPSTTKIYQDVNPDLLLPDVGQVQFAIQIGRAVTWTPHVKVQSLNQFITCPWELGAIDVRGTPREGINWRLTPVYVQHAYDKKYPPDKVP